MRYPGEDAERVGALPGLTDPDALPLKEGPETETGAPGSDAPPNSTLLASCQASNWTLPVVVPPKLAVYAGKLPPKSVSVIPISSVPPAPPLTLMLFRSKTPPVSVGLLTPVVTFTVKLPTLHR